MSVSLLIATNFYVTPGSQSHLEPERLLYSDSYTYHTGEQAGVKDKAKLLDQIGLVGFLPSNRLSYLHSVLEKK